jgi:hypothetical protein
LRIAWNDPPWRNKRENLAEKARAVKTFFKAENPKTQINSDSYG